jgi:methylamine dehydrogenase accessory protein MauD
MDNILIISSIVLWIVVLFNLLLTIALVRRINKIPESLGQPAEMLNVGDTAPNFHLETTEGRTVTQADFTGRQNVMVFIGPNCGFCKEQMPTLNDLYYKAQKSGIDLIVISLANIEETTAFANEYEFKAPIYAAPKEVNAIEKEYKVAGTPQYYLIDEQRKIQAADFFGPEWERLTRKWEDLKNEQAAEKEVV